MSRFKVERYCLCGSEMIIESDDLRVITDVDNEFTRRHTGVGHVPCTKRQATRQRRRLDQQRDNAARENEATMSEMRKNRG